MIPEPTPEDLSRDAERDRHLYGALKWQDTNNALYAWIRRCVAAERERDMLRASWELAEGTKVIQSAPNELLIETKTGDRRRISMACPQKFDEIKAERDALKETISTSLKEVRESMSVNNRLGPDEKSRLLLKIDSLQAERDALRAELKETADKLTQIRLHVLKDGSDRLNKDLAKLELSKHVSQATMQMEVGPCRADSLLDAKPAFVWPEPVMRNGMRHWCIGPGKTVHESKDRTFYTALRNGAPMMEEDYHVIYFRSREAAARALGFDVPDAEGGAK